MTGIAVFADHRTATHALPETLGRIQASNDYLAVRSDRPHGLGWLAAEDLLEPAAGQIDHLLAHVGLSAGTPRREAMANFFFSGYSWLLTAVVVGAFLLDRRVPALDPAAVMVRFDEGGYPVEMAVLSGHFTTLPDDPAAGDPAVTIVPDRASLGLVVGREIEGHLAPVVAVVRARAPLGTRALWLSVADSIAWSVVHHLKGVASRDEVAVQVAALTHGAAFPWRGRTGVVEIEARGRRELFVERASCCLNCKLPSAEHCRTCPLIPVGERERRLQAYLAEQV